MSDNEFDNGERTAAVCNGAPNTDACTEDVGRDNSSGDAQRAIEIAIDYEFADMSLFQLAMSHRSWCAENDTSASNERLEFLGDSILGLVVTERLYQMLPDMAEGELARVRSNLVNTATLSNAARAVGLGSTLRLGKGEDSSGGREKTSILADAMEAVFGAVHLDGGISASRDVIVRLLRPFVESAVLGAHGDPKSRLQEISVKRFGAEPTYVVTEEGPAHGRAYEASVEIGNQRWGPGGGSSKKEAEQSAASLALATLVDDEVGLTQQDGGTTW